MNEKKKINKKPIIIILAFILLYYVMHHIFLLAGVPTNSMEPAVDAGDYIFGSRLYYKDHEPKRGEIVCFYSKEEKILMVKRLIGLPGETVTIKNGKIEITDTSGKITTLKEDYLNGEWTTDNDGYVFEIPDNHYFFMGDNRNDSKDARHWDNPYIQREDIVSNVTFIMF